jgi:putative ABC transport system permease protein
MLINNLKTGIRNLWANKTISAINIIGLSLGLSAFLLILLWVENEYSVNKNVKDRDHIAAIMVNQTFESGEIQTYAATPPPLAKKLMESKDNVSSAATASWGDQIQFTVGDNKFTEYGLYASPEFLEVFSVELLLGSRASALKSPNTVLISESLSSKYFSNTDPVGKSIKTGTGQSYEVAGVFKSQDQKTTMYYSFLMPIQDYFSFNPFMANDWSVNNVRTYVKFDPNADFQSFNNKIKALLSQQNDRQKSCELFLFSMKDWYLKGEFKDGKQVGGRIKYVNLFSIVALIILLLSCINFVNLTTASATQRLKEIGVRKSLGANRFALIKRFLLESVSLSLISGGISIGLVYLLLPQFNQHFNIQLSTGFEDPFRLLVFTFIVLTVGLIAGIYPAFVLSGMDAVAALKKNMIAGLTNTTYIRKVLVTGQFAVTILLITGGVIISKQLDYFKDKDLGVDGQHLVWFPNQIPQDKIETAMREISQIKGVKQSALASMTFQGSNNRGHEVKWEGKNPGEDIFFNFIAGSHDLPATMGLEVVDGRNFSKAISTDTSAILLNETAVRQMNLKNPVGQYIETRNMKGTVIGVLKDFHFESLHSTIGPVIFNCRPDWTWNMYVKMDGSNDALALKSIEEVYKKFAPGQIFEYNHQNDQPQWFYRSEGQSAVLIKWFSVFAVFLSCLGLLGLTIFTIERKKKEISIRKILGANSSNLMVLVSKQFIILIAISILLSFVPSYYFTTQWLDNFPYSIRVEWYYFIFGPFIVFFVAIMTMSILIVKASLLNPVKSLRYE